MLKKFAFRFINGFCYAVAITLLVHAAIAFFTGSVPMLPEFTARYATALQAYMTELLLIGLMSAVTSGSTLVMEARKISLVLQSVLFILIMLSVWLPVACYVWGFHKYLGSMISTTASIAVTFGIFRYLQYRQCRKEIEEINARLSAGKE